MTACRDRVFGGAGTATGCGGFSRRFVIIRALLSLPWFMSPPSLTQRQYGLGGLMFHSVSGRQQRVQAFESFCGSNLSSKYAKLNTAVFSLPKRCRLPRLGAPLP